MLARRLLAFFGLAVPPKTPAGATDVDGPDYPDGYDRDGFTGGDARMAGTDQAALGFFRPTDDTPHHHHFKAGDPIGEWIAENDRWLFRSRPCTQDEADWLNTLDPDHDEHADVGEYDEKSLSFATKARVLLALVFASWIVVLALAYGAYKLAMLVLRPLFG
jgi:hypothetical protein